jgi:hypothetical protein
VNARSGAVVVWQLTRDTFRQARASGVLWVMLAVTAVCTALCLTVGVAGDVALRDPSEPSFFLPPAATTASPAPAASGPTAAKFTRVDTDYARRQGVETVRGRMTLAFGAVSLPVARERGDAVRFVELVLAWGVAGTLGLLLALVWTAGFVPAFLEPGAASVLLAKPAPRWLLLLGKYLGVLAFVGSQAALFVGLTWLALGLRTGVWDTTYWWAAPLMLVQFAVYYGFSVLLAVLTRGTAACAFGSVLFWLLAWGINYGSVTARGLSAPAPGHDRYLPPAAVSLAGAAYWVSPKPVDAGLILFNALDARHDFDKPAVFRQLEAWPSFSPPLSIVSSLAVAAALVAVSAHEFSAADY